MRCRKQWTEQNKIKNGEEEEENEKNTNRTEQKKNNNTGDERVDCDEGSL
jgi:hypothetical protein